MGTQIAALHPSNPPPSVSNIRTIGMDSVRKAVLGDARPTTQVPTQLQDSGTDEDAARKPVQGVQGSGLLSEDVAASVERFSRAHELGQSDIQVPPRSDALSARDFVGLNDRHALYPYVVLNASNVNMPDLPDSASAFVRPLYLVRSAEEAVATQRALSEFKDDRGRTLSTTQRIARTGEWFPVLNGAQEYADEARWKEHLQICLDAWAHYQADSAALLQQNKEHLVHKKDSQDWFDRYMLDNMEADLIDNTVEEHTLFEMDDDLVRALEAAQGKAQALLDQARGVKEGGGSDSHIPVREIPLDLQQLVARITGQQPGVPVLIFASILKDVTVHQDGWDRGDEAVYAAWRDRFPALAARREAARTATVHWDSKDLERRSNPEYMKHLEQFRASLKSLQPLKRVWDDDVPRPFIRFYPFRATPDMDLDALAQIIMTLVKDHDIWVFDSLEWKSVIRLRVDQTDERFQEGDIGSLLYESRRQSRPDRKRYEQVCAEYGFQPAQINVNDPAQRVYNQDSEWESALGRLPEPLLVMQKMHEQIMEIKFQPSTTRHGGLMPKETRDNLRRRGKKAKAAQPVH